MEGGAVASADLLASDVHIPYRLGWTTRVPENPVILRRGGAYL